ncbi:flavoprotein [Actinocorallia sp. API 0066]|uniref:flavoprotein n=1 Tax=Actinocorallia sp. API 0066 TaxID=2896846 RepID=UPI001E34B6B5|nr:flavoprotein [Actinocorallia sp. API 0066]MCD0452187.1 flavoprotein [Actinocorallia sp. API 0066]
MAVPASSPSGTRGVLYIVACAAPPASDVAELVSLARAAGWERIQVVGTPLGMRFLDHERLAVVLDGPARSEWRMPGEPKTLPYASAVIVAPATFNTINKWASGITDTFAVGLLCELTGAGVPILAVPCLKAELARHVAFSRSLADLRSMGVHVLYEPDAPAHSRMPPWKKILAELDGMLSP